MYRKLNSTIPKLNAKIQRLAKRVGGDTRRRLEQLHLRRASLGQPRKRFPSSLVEPRDLRRRHRIRVLAIIQPLEHRARLERLAAQVKRERRERAELIIIQHHVVADQALQAPGELGGVAGQELRCGVAREGEGKRDFSAAGFDAFVSEADGGEPDGVG